MPIESTIGKDNPQIHTDPPRLAGIFSDHMVLQCEQPIVIWGTGVPEDKLKIRLGSSITLTAADASGKFRTTLPPQPPGGPVELVVNGLGGTVVIQDVMIGEVWLCVGQSNMAWPVRRCTGAEQITSESNHPGLRLHPVSGSEGISSGSADSWKPCSPQSVADFSAVAYLCGRELHKILERPVGLILAAWGGSHCETWMDREALLNGEQSRRDLLAYEACLAGDYSVFTPPASTPRIEWAATELDDTEWPLMTVPGSWQDSSYFHHGVLWFRRHSQIPKEWIGYDLELCLGNCADEDQTYFNGELIGSTSPGKPGMPSHSRTYAVAGKLVRPGWNTLAVRISAFREGCGLSGPAGSMSIRPVGTEEKGSISLTGAWHYQVEMQTPMRNVAVHSWLSPRQKTPHELFDTMIAPLIPFNIRGVLWYQGEQNCWQAFHYRELFPQLIRSWRSHWGLGNFPFIYVQIPNAKERTQMPQASEWAELREAQSQALSEPATAMAVTIDCGEVDLHPKEKRIVAHRLAAAALATVYGKPVPYRSPHYSSCRRNGNSFTVEFVLEAGSTLKTSDGRPVRGFAVAGTDRRFVWALAVIEGASVIVWSPQILHPVAIRYAWANNPDCNLCDFSGLPAEPFRTDSCPGLTEPV